jgi:hypothetical protein
VTLGVAPDAGYRKRRSGGKVTKTNGGRPTAAQAAEKRQRAALIERYERQESKRAVPVQIDQPGTLYVLIALSGVTFLSSAALVANGTIAVAEFIGLAYGWMGWLAFGAVEVVILAFLLGYLVIGSKSDPITGAPRTDGRVWFGAMVAFSAITIFANAFHTLEFWDFVWVEPRMWMGVVLATAIPLSFILVSKMLASAVFAKAINIEEVK